MLALVGKLTVIDLQAACDPQEYRRLVRNWAEDVWAAYASQQELARRWVEAALEMPTGRK